LAQSRTSFVDKIGLLLPNRKVREEFEWATIKASAPQALDQPWAE
jgi:hypothetical protein